MSVNLFFCQFIYLFPTQECQNLGWRSQLELDFESMWNAIITNSQYDRKITIFLQIIQPYYHLHLNSWWPDVKCMSGAFMVRHVSLHDCSWWKPWVIVLFLKNNRDINATLRWEASLMEKALHKYILTDILYLVCHLTVCTSCSNVYIMMWCYVLKCLSACLLSFGAHHRNINVRSKTFALETGPQMLCEVPVVIWVKQRAFKLSVGSTLLTVVTLTSEVQQFIFSAEDSRHH